jgi:hypothetical protein
VHLVPLYLVGRKDWDQIIDVRCAGDVRGQGSVVVVAKQAPASAGAQRRPAGDRVAEALEGLIGLAEDDSLDARHARR